MTQIPSNWNELAQYSVYYELLGEDTSKLNSIYDESEFELDSDGKIVYYGASYDGGYSRDIAGGEFLRARHINENGEVVDVFLHYTQVFQPTEAARKTMDYATTILGIIYQNTNRQLAYMEDYITQAKRANEALEKLTELYNRFTVNASNMDTASKEASTYITADQIRAYLDAGMTLPQTEFITGVNIIPYFYYTWTTYSSGSYSVPEYIWYMPDCNSDGFYFSKLVGRSSSEDYDKWNVDEKVVNGSLLDSYLQEEVNKRFTNEHILDFFKSEGSKNIKSEVKAGIGYSTSIQWAEGELKDGAWDQGSDYDEDHYVSAGDYKRTSSLEEVLENNYNVYLNYSEMASIQDQVRAQIDVANNILSTITTMVGVANNDMNQNFNIGTATLATIENGLKNITINTH